MTRKKKSQGRSSRPDRPRDVSRQALSIARLLDGVPPGRYSVILQVPAHRRKPWAFELMRLEVLRRDKTKGTE